MNTQLDPHIKTAFDEIVAHTPEIGDRPTHDVIVLSPKPQHSSYRSGLAVAAATIAVVGVAGLVTVRVASSDTPNLAPDTRPPNVSNPAPTPTPNTVGSSPDPTTPTPTTVSSPGTELIAPGAVVCLDAGASPRALALCVEELGGIAIEAVVVSTDSFVMPVDPASPSDVADAATVGGVLNLPVRSLDTSLLSDTRPPSGTATTYLVLGQTNTPYAP